MPGSFDAVGGEGGVFAMKATRRGASEQTTRYSVTFGLSSAEVHLKPSARQARCSLHPVRETKSRATPRPVRQPVLRARIPLALLWAAATGLQWAVDPVAAGAETTPTAASAKAADAAAVASVAVTRMNRTATQP